MVMLEGNFVSLRTPPDFTSFHGKSQGLLVMLDAVEKMHARMDDDKVLYSINKSNTVQRKPRKETRRTCSNPWEQVKHLRRMTEYFS